MNMFEVYSEISFFLSYQCSSLPYCFWFLATETNFKLIEIKNKSNLLDKFASQMLTFYTDAQSGGWCWKAALNAMGSSIIFNGKSLKEQLYNCD